MKINAKHVPVLMGLVDGLNKLDVYKEVLYPNTIKPLDPESKEKARFRRNEAINDFCQQRHLSASRIMKRESESLIGKADKMMSDGNLLLVKVPVDRDDQVNRWADVIHAQALMMLHNAKGCYIYAHASKLDCDWEFFEANKMIQTVIANACHEAIGEMEEMSEIDTGDLVEQYDDLEAAFQEIRKDQAEVLKKIVEACGKKDCVVDGHKLEHRDLMGGYWRLS